MKKEEQDKYLKDIKDQIPEDWEINMGGKTIAISKTIKIGIYEHYLCVDATIINLRFDVNFYDGLNFDVEKESFGTINELMNYLNSVEWFKLSTEAAIEELQKKDKRLRIYRDLIHAKFMLIDNPENFTNEELNFLLGR